MSALDAFRARAAGQTHERFGTPLDMARALDPRTVVTPALELIADALVELADTPDGRLILSMPPQEGKSSLCSRRFPLWVLTRNAELRVAIASYEATVARRWGRAIRDDLASHPDLGLSVRSDVGAAHEWQFDGHDGGVFTVGVGGAFTGRAVDGALIIDDPIKDREQADSSAYRDRCWDWWTDVASTRLAPGTPVVLVLTRWHEDDLAGRLVGAPDGHLWRVINIPAQADHDVAVGESDPLGRAPGEFLVSARGRSAASWEAIKVRAGSRTWASLYQGRPAPAVGVIFHRDWFRAYEQPLWVEEADTGARRAPGLTVIQSWDMTFKDSAGSDFVVGQVWGQRGANVWLLDQVRGRWSFTETLRRVEQLAARWPQAATKLVEDKANGTAVIDSLRAKVGGLVPVNPTESKTARAEAVAPFVEAGNVHLPAAKLAPWVGDLLEELAAFPSAPHDDQVDAMSQALQRLLLGRSPVMNFLRQLATECPSCGVMYDVRSGWCRSCDWTDPERRVDVTGLPAAVDAEPVEVEVPALNRALGGVVAAPGASSNPGAGRGLGIERGGV